MQELKEKVQKALEEITALQTALEEQKEFVHVVGVRFLREDLGRLSNQLRFFKGDIPLGEKVVIPNAGRSLSHQFGSTPKGIVVMNGQYAANMAKAEGIIPAKDALLWKPNESATAENEDEENVLEE